MGAFRHCGISGCREGKFGVELESGYWTHEETLHRWCWIKKMILEKTEVLFCYGKYPILILMKTPIVKPVGLKM
jgi:hypothetical protein